MVDSPSGIRVLATELVKRVNDETRRIRLLEQRLDRVEAELNSLEVTVDSQNKDVKSQIDGLAKGLKSATDRIVLMESAVSRIEKELAKRATKAEFKQIESYMNLMSPITSKFVTKDEMERAIDERTVKKY